VPRLREGERYLKLDVADTGHGIPEEHLDTDGGIGVRSQVGRGTTFSVYIPELAPVAVERIIEAVSAPLPSLAASSGRLLLVDDEPLLLEVQAIVLRRAGYEVTATRDSAEARSLLTEDPLGFDLTITDLSMPRVSGLGLIRAAHAAPPGALGSRDACSLSGAGVSSG
jgi:hypothetical protein